jgi:hypothetical protein
MEPTLIISAVGGLAKGVIEIWKTHQSSRESALLREHQMRLELARHKHEVAIEKLRKGTLPIEEVPDTDYFRRLESEAALLSSFPLEVIFEPVGDGYGVGLPISSDLILAVWLSLEYPAKAPTVFLQQGGELSMIEFSPDSWEPDLTLVDVVAAVWSGAATNDQTKAAEQGKTAEAVK